MNISRNLRNGLLFLLVFLLTVSQSVTIPAYAGDNQLKLDDKIVLMVDNAKAYVKGAEKRIDRLDPRIVPIVKDGRTLVPVRFVSENFGATVNWDSVTSTATITADQAVTKITVGSKTLSVNGKEIVLDTAAEVINDRTYIPLRALVEKGLNKKVFYEDGLIIIYSNEQDVTNNGWQDFVNSAMDLYKPHKITAALGSEPYQMNTLLKTDSISQAISNLVNEGLTRYGQDGKAIPGLAEKWEVSADGLVWTFHLRESHWSDGTLVMAQDFRFAFLEALKKETAAEYSYLFYVLKNGMEYNTGRAKRDDVGIVAKDDKTLVLTLAAPTPYLPELLAFGNFAPIKQDFYQNNPGIYGADADKLLYSGPWIIKEWTHEEKLLLAKNPFYWNEGNIKIDEIEFRIVKSIDTALDMYFANELDIINISNGDAAAFEKAGYKVSSYADGATFYFEFNTLDVVMKNVNIRKALTYAIDREDYIKNIRKDKSVPATTFTNPVVMGENLPFAMEVGTQVKDNSSTEAKALLQKGLQELGLNTLPKISILTGNSSAAIKDAEAFSEYWRRNLGIETQIISDPLKTRLEKMLNKDFQITISGWSPDYNDPISFLEILGSSDGNNHTGYQNKAYDELLFRIRNEENASKRMNLLRNLEELLLQDMPVGPIYHRSRLYLANPRISGLVRSWNHDIDFYWTTVND
mgnify:CR=1 FL=1